MKALRGAPDFGDLGSGNPDSDVSDSDDSCSVDPESKANPPPTMRARKLGLSTQVGLASGICPAFPLFSGHYCPLPGPSLDLQQILDSYLPTDVKRWCVGVCLWALKPFAIQLLPPFTPDSSSCGSRLVVASMTGWISSVACEWGQLFCTPYREKRTLLFFHSATPEEVEKWRNGWAQ